MANSVWQISAQKFGSNFVGEIERQIFATFCLANKFGKIDPRGQFH